MALSGRLRATMVKSGSFTGLGREIVMERQKRSKADVIGELVGYGVVAIAVAYLAIHVYLAYQAGRWP
jgi:hypothetical protein